MSQGEVFALIASLGGAAVSWLLWYSGILRVSLACSPASVRLPPLVAPVAGALILLAVLVSLASHDVREDPMYVAFYALMGLAWTGVASLCLPMLGLSVRDDVAERGNAAAGWAAAGALVGVSLCFTGGNIGDGPGWWVVVFCASLSTGALLLAWIVLGRFAGLVDVLTIDRDLAAGIRTAGFLAASGLILGRAVAGNWESVFQTIFDFAAQAWMFVVLLAAELVISRLTRPTPSRPHAPILAAGTVPASAYLAAAALHTLVLYPVSSLT